MKRLVVCLFLMAFTSISWAIPRPMESIENYNIVLVHGAYGSDFRRSALHLFFPVILCSVMPASHPRSLSFSTGGRETIISWIALA